MRWFVFAFGWFALLHDNEHEESRSRGKTTCRRFWQHLSRCYWCSAPAQRCIGFAIHNTTVWPHAITSSLSSYSTLLLANIMENTPDNISKQCQPLIQCMCVWRWTKPGPTCSIHDNAINPYHCTTKETVTTIAEEDRTTSYLHGVYSQNTIFFLECSLLLGSFRRRRGTTSCHSRMTMGTSVRDDFRL